MLPLAIMFFMVLFNYTILRNTKDVLILGYKLDGNVTALRHTFIFGPFSAISMPQITIIGSLFSVFSRYITSSVIYICVFYIILHLSKLATVVKYSSRCSSNYSIFSKCFENGHRRRIPSAETHQLDYEE